MAGSQGNHLLTFPCQQEIPPSGEISQDETHLQPVEEGALLFEDTVLEPSENTEGVLYSTPRVRPVQTQETLSDAVYKAEKRRLKLERMKLKIVKLKRKIELLEKQIMLGEK